MDLVRGAVMLLMAIDHVRVFSGVPAGGPEIGVFFTRWVTHFCAPAFVFLAGTSSYFYGVAAEKRGVPSIGALTSFLLTRGVFLVVLELTVLRLFWTFDAEFLPQALAGVIWMLGWCFILMALVVRMPLKWIAWFGVLVIFLHNAVGSFLQHQVPAFTGSMSWLWKILWQGFWAGPIEIGSGASLMVLYSIFPWIGVMAAGYAFGALLQRPAAERDPLLRKIGLGAIALFVVLRALNLYGDPNDWTESDLPTWLAFLNTAKYPASLLFLLMTLGPTIALMPWLERVSGRVAGFVSVFGRVPMFYYILHIPLIHALALLVSRVSTGAVHPWLFENHPMGQGPVPDGYTWGLGTLYLVTAVTIALLYWPCKWYANKKATGGSWLYRYL